VDWDVVAEGSHSLWRKVSFVLAEVEWSGEHYKCPVCYAQRHGGHRDFCELMNVHELVKEKLKEKSDGNVSTV